MDNVSLRTEMDKIRASAEDLQEMDAISTPNRRIQDNVAQILSSIETMTGLLSSSTPSQNTRSNKQPVETPAT